MERLENIFSQRIKQAHLQFAQANAKTENCKRATLPTALTQRLWTDKPWTGKKGEGITAPTQKAGFRVPKTVLWLIKH